MFTQNYITLQKRKFMLLSDSSNEYSDSVNLKNVENANAKCYAVNASVSEIGGWMGKGKCKTIVASESCYPYDAYSAGVYFGTGNTPATLNDYNLEAPITSGLSITNPRQLVTKQEGNTYIISAPMIVSNTTITDISIYEMGIFTPVMQSYSDRPTDSGKTVHYCLMERTVLDEPITIPAGESKLVTYKITFNQGMS